MLGLFWKRFYSLLIFLLFIRLGSLLTQIQNPPPLLPDLYLSQESWIQLEVKEVFNPSEKFQKYKARILSADSLPVSNQQVLLYWKKENPPLFTKDKVWLKTKLQPLPKPLNPYQFDYGKYLKRQKIQYVCFQKDKFYIETNSSHWQHKLSYFKKSIYQDLVKSGYTKNSADIIAAMLLGDRAEMDEEIVDNYRKTGVVHVLSISGLHIMIVYTIFYLLLFPIRYLKKGKHIRIIVSLTLIWSYVILVGFQPPVLRSALMILIYQITVLFNRKPNVYHTLALSALILLLFHTNYLFDVGFQLSYSAIFFIVFFHPVYQKIFRPKTKFARNCIGFLGTCISAQLGTFPIATYYFHQTTGLFLAGNLVMVFASNLMIAGGMISIGLNCFNLELPFWISIFNGLIQFCNDYMEWLSQFDLLIFEGISFSVMETFWILGIIILFKFVLETKNFKYIFLFLSCIFLFQIQRYAQNQKLDKKKEIVVFHQTKNTIIGARKNSHLSIYIRNLEDTVRIHRYILQPYIIRERIKTWNYFPLETPSDSVLKSKIVVIQDNSLLNELELKHLPEIIIDGSNYPNFELENSAKVWQTHQSGAKVIPLP